MYPYNYNSANNYKNSHIGKENITAMEERISNEVLQMILLGISETKAQEEFFKNLYNSIDERYKEPIYNMYLDEKKHFIILTDLYKTVTGTQPQNLKYDKITLENKLPDTLEKIFSKKLDDVDYYKTLLITLVDIKLRDLIFEIITDTLKHNSLLTHLILKLSA